MCGELNGSSAVLELYPSREPARREQAARDEVHGHPVEDVVEGVHVPGSRVARHEDRVAVDVARLVARGRWVVDGIGAERQEHEGRAPGELVRGGAASA